MDYKQVFYDDDEELEAVLGRSFIESLLTGRGLSKGALILSDKRLYQKGRRYDSLLGRGWSAVKGSSVVEVSDITGTSFGKHTNIATLVVTIIFFVIGCLGGFYYFDISYWDTSALWIFIPALLPAVFFYWLYTAQKLSIFMVNYSGGAIGMNASWFSHKELDEFQRSISRVRAEAKKREI